MRDFFRAIWVIAYRDLIRFVQERARLISSFAMPLMFLVIFGAGFSQMIGNLTPGVDFLQFMYPGIIAMSVLMGSLMSGLSVVWDREFGFLKEVLVAPLSRAGIVLGKTVGTAAISLGQGLIMLALAPVIGVTVDGMLILKLIPLIIIVSMAMSGFGILLASRMRSMQGFQLLANVILMPLVFLSGVFFPVNNVPTWLEVISKVNPLTYGVDAIRQAFLDAMPGIAGVAATPGVEGMPPPPTGVTVLGHTMTILEDAAVVAVLGAVLVAAAVVAFNRRD
jgi:ABC-2 type transport system permease protein